MTDEQLKRGQELKQLIKTTEEALNNLKEIKPSKTPSNNFYADNIYYLTICEHRDGSGKKGDLCRSYGNERLLKLIIDELETQLGEFKEWYAKV